MNVSDQVLGGVFFDTHAEVKKLKEAGASEKLAEAQVEMLSRFAEKELVTKGHFDLRMQKLENNFDLKLENLKGEMSLIKWMLGFVLVFCLAILAKLLI